MMMMMPMPNIPPPKHLWEVALGANGTHGLKRSNADKQNAVKMAYENRVLLGIGENPSARVIADLCGVSHTFVQNQVATVATWSDAPTRTGKDGKSVCRCGGGAGTGPVSS